MFSHVNVWCFMKPKGANKQGNACNIRCAIHGGGGGQSDLGNLRQDSKTSTNCFKMTQEHKLQQK